MIENLPLLTPDASRNAKTVVRCHERLAARRQKLAVRNRAASPRAFGAERVLVAGFCVAYLIAMASPLFTIAARR